jgi:uncharacterized RDD family membrane protein YckC
MAYATAAGTGGIVGSRRVARMGRRFFARLVDFLVVGVVADILLESIGDELGPLVPVGQLTGDSAHQAYVVLTTVTLGGGLLWLVKAGIVGFLYEWFMVATVGATIGKLLFGVRVLDVATGRRTGTGAVKRAGALFVASLLSIIGLLFYISPLFDQQRRGWHDKIAGTIAVRSR